MKKSRFTDNQVVSALKRVEAGIAVPQMCRRPGISTATFYKWRAEFCGMDTSMTTRMEELEDECRRLKKIYLEEKLNSEVVAEAPDKKVVRPSRRREMAQLAVQMLSISIPLACAAFMAVSPATAVSPNTTLRLRSSVIGQYA